MNLFVTYHRLRLPNYGGSHLNMPVYRYELCDTISFSTEQNILLIMLPRFEFSSCEGVCVIKINNSSWNCENCIMHLVLSLYLFLSLYLSICSVSNYLHFGKSPQRGHKLQRFAFCSWPCFHPMQMAEPATACLTAQPHWDRGWDGSLPSLDHPSSALVWHLWPLIHFAAGTTSVWRCWSTSSPCWWSAMPTQ